MSGQTGGGAASLAPLASGQRDPSRRSGGPTTQPTRLEATLAADGISQGRGRLPRRRPGRRQAAAALRSQASMRHARTSILGAGAALGIWALYPRPAGEATSEATSTDSVRSNISDTSSSDNGQSDQLQLVQVVFRHGARTPLGKRYWPELNPRWDVCGTDSSATAVPVRVTTEDGRPRPPNPDDDKQINQKFEGGCSKGQLTLLGQQQAVEFGRYLRWRYSMVHGLLPDQYEPGVVAARTTSWARTIATLQGVLSGLFPGTKQPIEVHTNEEIDEILYTNVKSCKRLHLLLSDLQSQLKTVTHPRGEDKHVRELAGRVRTALGLPSDHIIHWVDLHDAMTTMLAHGKEVPAGMQDAEVLRGVNQLATARFMHVVAPHPDTGKTQEVLRLGMGVLMELMVRRMEAAASAAAAAPASSQAGVSVQQGAASSGGGSSSPGAASSASASSTKMYLYSGHDSSLMPLLAALGKHVTDWPPYLSNLALELWRRPSGEHYVKVLYNRKELPLTELCGSASCELQLFKDKVIGPYLLTRDMHQKECMLHFLHDQPAGEHVQTEEVAVGSSFQDEAAPSAAANAAAAAAAAGAPAAPAAAAAGGQGRSAA